MEGTDFCDCLAGLDRLSVLDCGSVFCHHTTSIVTNTIPTTKKMKLVSESMELIYHLFNKIETEERKDISQLCEY
jgi:hypothetical protein